LSNSLNNSSFTVFKADSVSNTSSPKGKLSWSLNLGEEPVERPKPNISEGCQTTELSKELNRLLVQNLNSLSGFETDDKSIPDQENTEI
jgi:hypothetical protein